jgi:hypothetical protein
MAHCLTATDRFWLMSKNSALRALFEAIQKGDRSAVAPLADHLDMLGAIDLATSIREAVPKGA